MEEDLGELISRYYVVKIAGIFSKNPKIMEIYENGFLFTNPNKGKSTKGKDTYLYSQLGDVIFPNEKDVTLKMGKSGFNVNCTERSQMLADLLLQKDLHDLRANTGMKPAEFEGFLQVDLSDTETAVPVNIKLLRSSLLISYNKEEKKKCFHLKYPDIESITPLVSELYITNRMTSAKYLLSPETVVTFVEAIKELSKKYLAYNLTLKSEFNLVEKKLVETEEYCVITKVKRLGGVIKEVRVHVDATFIIEEDIKEKKVGFMQDLSQVSFIKVIRKSSNLNVLKLYTYHNMNFKYRLSSVELDYLLSNILHSLQTRDEIDQLPALVLEPTNLNYKVHSIPPESDSNYETSAKKEIGKVGSSGDMLSEFVITSLLDAALNIGFKGTGFDPKFLSLAFSLLQEMAVILKKHEDSLESVKDYMIYIEHMGEFKRNGKVEPFESEAGKILFGIYARLPLVMLIIRNMLLWRPTAPDLATFQKQIEILLALCSSKDSVVSINASLTLRSFLRLSKSADKRIDSSTRRFSGRDIGVLNRIYGDILEVLRGYVNEKKDASSVLSSEGLKDRPYLHLYGLLSIFEVIFMEKKELTHSEDLAFIVNSTLDQDKALPQIEQLIKYDSKPVVYQASLLSAQSLLLLYNSGEKGQLSSKQHDILFYTTILLWNIRLVLSSMSARQQRLSSSFAALIVVNNAECCNIIDRMFPKFLFKKIDAVRTKLEWKPEHWKDFFRLLQNNYRTATEQWNDECRAELIKELDTTVSEIDRGIHPIKRSGEMKEAKIRWNHEEYQIKYLSLEKKCKVGKYYLTELLNQSEGLFPYLNENIMKPQSFWNKLVYKFLGTSDIKEQQLILTVMNLVYNDHFQIIRDIKILPYLIKLLNETKLKALHTLILELIFSTLKIKYPSVVLNNYELILGANGLQCLIELLSRTFTTKKDEKSKKAQRSGLIIRIFDLMLKTMDKPNVFPASQVRAFCQKHIGVIIQTLLVENIELRKKTMKFLSSYFLQETLKDTGIIDFLLLCLNDKTGSEALGLLHKIQSSIEDYNLDMDFSSFSSSEKELLNNNDKIKNSVLLRFFPIPFVKYIVEEIDFSKVITIFNSDKTEDQSLIWTKEMRELLVDTLQFHIKPFQEKLKEYVKSGKSIEEMPEYLTKFSHVIDYPNIKSEIRCAEYYLRIWNKNKIIMENIHQIVFFYNLETLFQEITSKEISSESLCIVMKSFSIVYSDFNKKGQFSGFKPLFEHVYSMIESKKSPQVLKSLLRSIYYIIKDPSNYAKFQEARGFKFLIEGVCKILEETLSEALVQDIISVKYVLAIIFTLVRQHPTDWGNIVEEYRKKFFTLLFKFVFILQKFLFESLQLSTECIPVFKESQKMSDILHIKIGKKDDINYGTSKFFSLHDYYCISNAFQILELGYSLVNFLSTIKEHVPELVESGWGILSLWQIFIPHTPNYEKFKSNIEIGFIQCLALMSFRHLAGFAINSDLSQKYPYMKNYLQYIRSLLSDHLLALIVKNMETGDQIREPPMKSLIEVHIPLVIKTLSTDIIHAQCVWNDNTRWEFKQFVLNQLQLQSESPDIPLKEIQYKSHENELIVDGVFLRVIQKDPEVTLVNPTKFFKSLILQYLEPKQETNLKTLVEISLLILKHQNMDYKLISTETIAALCKFIKQEDLNIWVIIYEFAKRASSGKTLFLTKEFVEIIYENLLNYSKPLFTNIENCLTYVIKLNDPGIDAEIVNSGLILLFFSCGLNKKMSNEFRIYLLKLLQILLKRTVISNLHFIIPSPLIEDLKDEQCKIEQFIEILDTNTPTISLIWDKELQSKVLNSLDSEISIIKKKSEETNKFSWIIPEVSLIEKWLNPNEIIVSGVILSVYNRNPHIKLRVSATVFLDKLCESLLLGLKKYNYLLEVDKSPESKQKEVIVQGISTMLASLIFGYEQTFRNHFNLNQIATEEMVKKELGGEHSISAFSNTTLKEIINDGLNPQGDSQINVMILQLIFLLCEQREIINKDDLVFISRKLNQQLLGYPSSEASLEIMLIFSIIDKMIERITPTKAKETALEFITQPVLLEKLKALYTSKPASVQIEIILQRILQFPYYLSELQSAKFEISHLISLDTISRKKYDHKDSIWRLPPSSKEECNMFQSCMLIKDFGISQFYSNLLPVIPETVLQSSEFPEVYATLSKSI